MHFPPPSEPNHKPLFLVTMRDLEARASLHDEYEILGASALIRKLLFDVGTPLVHKLANVPETMAPRRGRPPATRRAAR